MRSVFYTHQNMFPNLSHQWLHWNSELPHQNFHPETKWILGPLVKYSARLPYITNISLVFNQEFNLHLFLLAQGLSESSLGVFFPWHPNPERISPPLCPIPGWSCARAPSHLLSGRTNNLLFWLGTTPTTLPGFQSPPGWWHFLVGDPYKPSFATVTGRGDDPSYNLLPVPLDLHTQHHTPTHQALKHRNSWTCCFRLLVRWELNKSKTATKNKKCRHSSWKKGANPGSRGYK